MSSDPTPISYHSPPLRRTLRDSLVEAEQLRGKVRIRTSSGEIFTGRLSEVGIDFAEISSREESALVALFYVESIEGVPS